MSEYRSDEEAVEVIARWWKENGTFLIAAIVLAIAGVLGWNWWQGQTIARAEGAASLYLAWQRAEAEEAAVLAERLREDYPRSAYRGLIALETAGAAMTAGDTEAAKSALREALELDLPRQMQDLARIRLARIALDAGDPEAALAELEVVTGRGDASLAEELRGDALLELGRDADALAAYERALVAAASPRPLLEIKLEDLRGRQTGEIE